MNNKKVLLIIMDGWGKGRVPEADAIAHARVPFVTSLYKKYPHSELLTCGEDVGLPEGQMGNSEVGHLNIGAGRIVYQELQRINVAIKSKELEENKVLQEAFQKVKKEKVNLHFIGLVSDGGVHSHLSHLKALTQMAQNAGIENYFVHAFTDGRDTDPKSGLGFLQDLQNHLQNRGGKIATVTGRYYAMDRDKRWQRVKLAYEAMVHGKGSKSQDLLKSIEDKYKNNQTDEFIEPIIHVDESGQAIGRIQDNDVVICFNFRTDRCREITEMLVENSFPELETDVLPLHYITMTEYDKTFKNVKVIFHNDNLINTLGETLSAQNKTQLRMAETEKYPHVTFFFSGGRELPFQGEERIMVASPKEVATYDLKPEMSAYPLTEKLLTEIEIDKHDFICINFANTDMVGHTGVWEAVIKAAETVDACVEKIVTAALLKDYSILVTADHGNSDFMINADGSPNTAHTLNPVPLFLISKDYKGALRNGRLADIAPTILKMMNLNIPDEMTGNCLVD